MTRSRTARWSAGTLSLTTIAAMSLLLGIVGCSGKPAVETPKDGGAATNTGTDPGRSPPAAGTPGKGATPSMPEDVPIYPNAAQTKGTSVGTQTVGSWKTEDATKAVIAFYEEKLPASGWTVEKNDGSALGATIQASKQGRKLTVAITTALPKGAVVHLSHRP